MARAALAKRLSLITPRLGLIGKAKVAIGFFQVVLVMPEVFDVPMPKIYFEWMAAFQWLSFDLPSLVVPDACVGPFRQRLLLTALGPLVPLAALGFIDGSASEAPGSDDSDGSYY